MNSDGEESLPLAMEFWGTEQETRLEGVRDALAAYGKTILEFCVEAGIDPSELSFDQLIPDFRGTQSRLRIGW
ncbi:MAG TPA: hypothetical protein PLI18_08215 [Pirellulaceae bacterium]|nr:hypothetical protein [Pirellulaceae bacterium]